ncbi:MAG: hypothetical protein E6G28_03565 [Actinobacteria bacterium]|nr:MAG: hypothetical protein E6G28_03565 [Actinomycetota bacterium]
MSSDSPLPPLDVLYEDSGLTAEKVPPELRRLYGGNLGFEEPCVYANFVSTLEGAVAIPSLPKSNSLINMESEADLFVVGLLRTFADVVLIGSGVLRASPRGTWLPEKVYPSAADTFAELRRSLGKRETPEVAILSGHGSIDPAHPVLESGAFVLTSTTGAEKLAGRLPAAAEVVPLGEDTTIDGKLVVLEAGVVDELFLTLSPLLVGRNGADRFQLVEAADLLPHGVRGRLASLRRHGDHLFLRYGLNASG